MATDTVSSNHPTTASEQAEKEVAEELKTMDGESVPLTKENEIKTKEEDSPSPVVSLTEQVVWTAETTTKGLGIVLLAPGFLALNVTKPRTLPSFRPHNLDVFFTSVSATTVSSMSTVEMEVFSNAQLVFMTILMFLGGEAFTSFLRLQLMKLKLVKKQSVLQNNDAFDHSSSSNGEVIILLGSSLVSIYITFIPCAKQILNEKGLNLHTFSIFTTVSTFANCGFVPTNENMMVFKQNSGLLLILIPQILLGNTLYAPSLRFVIWFLWKFTKRQEFENILKNSKRVGYSHIFPCFETIAIAITVLAFISVQFVAFCSLEWNSEATAGLSTYQKLVGSLFEVVNTRHTGQSVFDISSFSPAIIVLFALMM
ncbi:putative isoflavone 2'-hydroxylase-like [Capsicum annuum]|nr:putative isoflavone 2'-hydroxylase-like [Capsicum annuum]